MSSSFRIDGKSEAFQTGARFSIYASIGKHTALGRHDKDYGLIGFRFGFYSLGTYEAKAESEQGEKKSQRGTYTSQGSEGHGLVVYSCSPTG